jgi:osmotically-inducible protein OsmY
VDSHEQISHAVKVALATEGVNKVVSSLQVSAKEGEK